jgi:thioredoxin reductase (NADPH)
VQKFNVLHIPTGQIKCLDVECIFVAIGRGADTDIIDPKVTRNESGYIVTNEKMQTNLSGVYAIGDIRNTPLRQIVTAVSDGAIASVSAFTYIKSLKKDN